MGIESGMNSAEAEAMKSHEAETKRQKLIDAKIAGIQNNPGETRSENEIRAQAEKEAEAGTVESLRRDEVASFEGWDFSYLTGRWEEESPALDYETRAREILSHASSGLDMGTGGGEFLESLRPLPQKMCAIEYWEPNVATARARLEPLGVSVSPAKVGEALAFLDGTFDVIINRQASFITSEVARVLHTGGKFLTQQVPGDNLHDLVREFGVEPAFPNWTLQRVEAELNAAGLHIEEKKEWSGRMTFHDVGALVYYLKNVPWVVPDFSVEKYRDVLLRLQERIKSGQQLTYTQKRFLVEASKK